MRLMVNLIQPKWQTMEEICRLLDIPIHRPSKGSSVPHQFFSDIATRMGIPPQNSMPAIARIVIEKSSLSWSPSFSSEHTNSGGGSTVTALGLLQLKNAVLVWLGKTPLPVPMPQDLKNRSEWEPDSNWRQLRENLTRENRIGIGRPGAEEFRSKVLSEYENMCAISRFKAESVLDVAHIVPYFGTGSDTIQNAILMRSDLHRLFDRGLMLILFDEGSELFYSQIHNSVMDDFAEFNFLALALPKNLESHPSKKAIELKKSISSVVW